MTKLSITIPCYNEAQSLPRLFDACRKTLTDGEEAEFIFVNNGSKDNSTAIFYELLAKPENAFAKVVNVPINQGYGYGILQGLRQAQGTVLAWTHADLQTDPADVISAFKMYQKELLEGTILVKGRRLGRNFFDAFFTAGMSAVASVLLSVSLSDINAQPKMFHHDLLSKLDKAPHDFSLDVYILYIARREKMKIVEVPVVYGNRHFGQAKGGGTLSGKINLIKRTFKFILDLRKGIRKGER
jgi:glycosyltransferase involved in cell wall biosynthesis